MSRRGLALHLQKYHTDLTDAQVDRMCINSARYHNIRLHNLKVHIAFHDPNNKWHQLALDHHHGKQINKLR